MIELSTGDISESSAEVLVNAANGKGYMGGRIGAKRLLRGVAETLQYKTGGLIEKEAKKAVREKGFFNLLFGLKPGTYYITSGCGLPCKTVFHAVTMRSPGSKSSYENVQKCIHNLYDYCMKEGLFSIAIPCLGCGTGRLSEDKVIEMIKDIFKEDFWEIKIFHK